MTTEKKKPIITTSRLRGPHKAMLKDAGPEAVAPEEIQEDEVPADLEISMIPTYHGKAIVAVIPSWNCRRWLVDTFRSLSVQSLDREMWGVLLMDDGSDDNTGSLCRRYGVEHVRMNKRRGKAHALNFASRILDPETVMAELDADDSLEPTALELMLAAWRETPEAAIVYSNYYSCGEDLLPSRRGHGRAAGTDIEDAGWISHLKTYRAGDLIAAGGLDEGIRKSIDKDLVYRLQELAERQDKPIVYVPEILYRYRRRKEGSITEMKEDATLARRRAVRRRTGLSEDVTCVWSASEANESGGPGIFWGRLMAEIGKDPRIHVVEHFKDSDVIIGNVRMPEKTRHDRPWVLRIDGVIFNSREDYQGRNERIGAGILQAEGVVYQGAWGREMVEEYCGTPIGKQVVIRNGADPPEGWRKKKKVDRKIILACSRWGTKRPRYFKRLEETIEGFWHSKLEEEGYTLVVAGEHYLTDDFPFREHVRFVGRITSEEVWELLSEAAAVVHLSWFDCCPNTVIEAMAAKVPVVYCAQGTSEIAGSVVGERVLDSVLNHPCDITKPPNLDIEAVSNAMKNAVAKPGALNFPDVSIKVCAQQYAEFILEVANAGRIVPEEVEEEKGDPVVFDTENWR